MGPVPAGYKSAIAFDFFPASTMAFTDAMFHQSEEIFGLGVEVEDLESPSSHVGGQAEAQKLNSCPGTEQDCGHWSRAMHGRARQPRHGTGKSVRLGPWEDRRFTVRTVIRLMNRYTSS